MPAVSKAQTIKQAKAAYKARGRPSITEKEQRQLERAVELEARAERVKENEKRWAEAAKKRVEKENRDKAESGRARHGSQRRYDRFGFKASQFHLGAFLEKPNHGQASKQHSEAVIREDGAEADEDMFDDVDVDDEMLLQALDQPVTHTEPQAPAHPNSDAALMPSSCLPRVSLTLQLAKSAPGPVAQDDLNSFWDELDSATQIARELDEPNARVSAAKTFGSGSFSSGEFDLTAEDLNELDPPEQKPTELSKAPLQRVSPSPAIPAKFNVVSPRVPIDLSAWGEKRIEPANTAPVAWKQMSEHLMARPQMPSKRVSNGEGYANIAESSQGPGLRDSASAHVKEQSYSKAMPPPPPPLQPKTGISNTTAAKPFAKANGSQPSVPLMAKMKLRPKSPFPGPIPPQSNSSPPKHVQNKPSRPIRDPLLPASSLYCSLELGFTLSQLEKYVDDDIQLTQTVPG